MIKNRLTLVISYLLIILNDVKTTETFYFYIYKQLDRFLEVLLTFYY